MPGWAIPRGPVETTAQAAFLAGAALNTLDNLVRAAPPWPAAGLIAAGPRSPRPGAPSAYVTTKEFLSQFGFESLRDLPDLEMLEDAGLIDQPSAAAQDTLRESSTADAGTLLFDLARSFGVIADEGEPKADAARCSKGEREMFRLPRMISV